MLLRLLCFIQTLILEGRSYLSTVTLVKALDSVAVKIEVVETPIIIHNTENKRATVDLGVLSPYLVIHSKIDQ